MKYPKPRRRQVRTKTVIMTGGLNDIVTNLELTEGEMHQCLNYMEIDSPYHGYASVLGYEAYDGKTLASTVPALALVDEGDDDNTVFLMETPTGFTDISDVGSTVVNYGIILNENVYKFEDASFDFAGTLFTVLPQTGKAFSNAYSSAFDSTVGIQGAWSFQGDFTVDIQIQPKVRNNTETIFEKAGVARLTIDSLGFLKFEVSTSAAYVYDYSITQVNRAINTTVFTHVSICNHLQTLRIAIDGIPLLDVNGDVLEVPIPLIYNSTAKLFFGCDYQLGNYFHAYVDEIRYSNVARWYHAFVPPTRRYSDPLYSELNWEDIDREDQRSIITEVPGSGPCTGVAIYMGETYALRNSEDGLSAALWKAYSEPDGLGGIDDTMSGWILIDDTFNPDGRMDSTKWRFSGSFVDQQILCIVDGASLPRIWDGNTDTMYLFDGSESVGIPDRQDPARYAKHVSIFDNRLVLGYDDDDIFLSSKTNPRDFTGGYGDQLLIGDKITNFQELPGESLGIFCRNSIKVLTKLQVPTATAATPDYTFKVDNFSREAGAIEWTADRVLSKILYADDRGIIDFGTSDKYGDFDAAAISKKLNRIYLDQKLNITCSLKERQINQYRLFFNTGAALWFTFLGEELKGGTYVVYPMPVMIAEDGEDKEGNIVKYFCSTDGFIYKMDSGTSFNGEEIRTQLNSSFYHYGSPRNWKQFQRVIFEMDASKGTRFNFRPSFDYDSSKFPETLWWLPLLTGVSGIWGEDTWGAFVWGGSVTQELVHYIRGHGRNMSLEVMTNSKYNQRHIIHNAIVDYTLENLQE